MRKAKYSAVFVVIVLCVVYQILLSFDVVPYIFSGQDLFVIVLLLVSLMQLFMAGSLEKMVGRRSEAEEDVTVAMGADKSAFEIGDFNSAQGKSALKHVLSLQRYLRESQNMKDLVSRMLVASARNTKSARASVLLFDERAGELYIHRTLGWSSAEIKLASATRVKPGEGIAGRVFLEGKPIVMNQPDDRIEFEPKDKYKSNSFACFPLVSGWETTGVLNLTEKENETFSQDEIDLVTFIIQEASLILLKRSGKREKAQ
jgi:transcriptional regulator with GAF, ATPase, and Fis domain